MVEVSAGKIKVDGPKPELNKYQKFCQQKRNEGHSIAEAAELWPKKKANPARQ